ncbi:hypothetical protein [Heliothis virescens ascovirus 3j]|uniref:Uncharacterized protein n=1 Tax=Heliothis virescens ascovirus 3j TaxID=1561067 RepID=A0A2Z5UZ97_9VIRU|nr:hypothetical protein [Heliothis virescens ascovirus 3j]
MRKQFRIFEWCQRYAKALLFPGCRWCRAPVDRSPVIKFIGRLGTVANQCASKN